MRVRDQVLRLFLTHPESIYSGQALGDHLQVSRNAVWKAVQELKEAGYDIESIPQQGYRLKQVSSALDGVQITYDLPSDWQGLKVEIYDAVTSTNDVAKEYAIEAIDQPALFISQEQTRGRGRQGRPFYSALETGLYYSLVVQPKDLAPEDIPMYTLAAASAVLLAMEEVFSIKAQVKWVNDIFYQGRKIAGILSEATTNLEDGKISSIIIGIGVNVQGNFEDMDTDLTGVAGAIFKERPESLNLNTYLNRFLHHFIGYHQDLTKRAFMPLYESRLLGLGKKVTYVYNNHEESGVIEGLDQQGHLLVRDHTGKVKPLLGQDIHFSSQQFASPNREED